MRVEVSPEVVFRVSEVESGSDECSYLQESVGGAARLGVRVLNRCGIETYESR